MCIEKDSRVSVTNSKAMLPWIPEQRSYYFSIHEGKNIGIGTTNIEIAEFLLTEEVFTSEQELRATSTRIGIICLQCEPEQIR